MQVITVPPLINPFGFRFGSSSVHTSRTMMVDELTQLLGRFSPDSPRSAYQAAIIEENVLGKPTRSARQDTAGRLVELYALDPGCTLFRLFRSLWDGGAENRPMLALLLASARDPLLRELTPRLLEIPQGELVTPGSVAEWVVERYPGRFRPSTLNSAARNLASSWTQAGYLRGAREKRRSNPRVTPVVVAFALMLGYLGGLRGRRLLNTTWMGLLDRPPTAIAELAMEASKQGWLCLKTSGSVVEVRFPGLLTPAEERACREQD